MNREIKFRAWWRGQEKFDYIDSFKKFSSYSFPLDWCVIQQYTGLKDKNGIEIYEGDLLVEPRDTLPNYFEVIWSLNMAGFDTKIHRKHNKMIGKAHVYAESLGGYEICGNIFENPELLKQ